MRMVPSTTQILVLVWMAIHVMAPRQVGHRKTVPTFGVPQCFCLTMKLNVFFASVFFGSFSTQNQQTSWSSSEWVWLSRLARLWAYTRQVTSTDVWIWIIWHCWMLQVLLHSFTSGIHTVPVAKGTNGERHWWLLLSRASPYRDMGFFCFSMREDTCRIRCSGTLCISQGNLDGENFFFVAVCWMFFFGCFFRRNPDVAFLFQRPPNDGRKSVTIQVYSSSTTLRWGSGAQQSKVMKDRKSVV